MRYERLFAFVLAFSGIVLVAETNAAPWVGADFFPARHEVLLSSPVDYAQFADFDEDGNLDLAVARGRFHMFDDRFVGIARGNGDGSFESIDEIAQEDVTMHGIFVADVNGDTHADVLLSRSDPANPLRIFVGDGAGGLSFLLDQSLGALSNAGDIDVGDIDGDGLADVAAANNDSVAVFFGQGDGSFTDVAYFTYYLGRPHVEDIDGDGRDDLVLNRYGVDIAFGSEDRQLALVDVLDPPCNSFAIAGDLNADGIDDLIAFSGCGLDVVWIYPGLGGRSYGTSVDVPYCEGREGNFAGDPFATDVTGDGIDDLVTLCGLYPGASGQFPDAFEPHEIIGLVPGDIDGDDYVDIGGALDGRMHFLLSSGAGSLADADPIDAVNRLYQPVIVDVDDDGTLDVVGLDYYVDLEIDVVLGDCDRALDDVLTSPVPGTAWRPVPGDLNLDGSIDLLLRYSDSTGDDLVSAMGSGDGMFTPTPSGTMPPFTRIAALADIDEDDVLDVVGWNSQSLITLRGVGDGTFEFADTHPWNGYEAVVVEDMDLDGHPDVVGLASDIDVFVGAGDGTFEDPLTLGSVDSPASVVGAEIVDLNRDGRMDVVMLVETYVDRCMSVVLGQEGSLALGGEIRSCIDVEQLPWPASFRLAQIDPDTELDVVLKIEPGSIGVMEGDGGGSFSNLRLYGGWYAPGNPIEVADLDCDQRPDVILGGFPATILWGTGDPVVHVEPVSNTVPAAQLAVAPNPFNESVRFSLPVTVSGDVAVSIFDAAGARVHTFTETSARHPLTWDGRTRGGGSVAPGVYFVRIEVPGDAYTTRVVLVE